MENTYRVCVTKYGFADIDSENQEDAVIKAEDLPEDMFDWGDAGDAVVVEQLSGEPDPVTDMEEPCICRTLSLSTTHISPEVMKVLDEIYRADYGLVLYPKEYQDGERVGYFICVPDADGIEEIFNDFQDHVEPIRNIINLAVQHQCEWVDLDRDGHEYQNLKRYKWD